MFFGIVLHIGIVLLINCKSERTLFINTILYYRNFLGNWQDMGWSESVPNSKKIIHASIFPYVLEHEKSPRLATQAFCFLNKCVFYKSRETPTLGIIIKPSKIPPPMSNSAKMPSISTGLTIKLMLPAKTKSATSVLLPPLL